MNEVVARGPKAQRSRLGVALVVGGYVIPLVVAVVLLLFVDPTIAVGLAVVEVSTVLGIRFAMRAPDPRAQAGRAPGDPILGLPGDYREDTTTRDFTRVAFAMVGIVAVLVVVSVIASHFG